MTVRILVCAFFSMWLAVAAMPARSQGKGDKAFGEYLAGECVTCHQLSGKFDGIPPIIGWPDEAFIEIMNEYRTKKRDNAVMQTIVNKLSDEEVAALAAYFGSLSQPTTTK
ncbi:MAG: c-type cytochrome [Beijerinckiaceae bacterium]